MGALSRWWFTPVPRARVAALRTLAYGFILVDVFLTTSWVAAHQHIPGDLYHPLRIGRMLPLPTPTPAVVTAVMVALTVASVVALIGRAPRAAGAAVFVLYLEWMVIAFSYGKVDHDRFAFLVALAVLPTVGRAGWRDVEPDDRAGWALRCIQVAVVSTYVLAAWAKLRYGGLAWLDSSTLLWATVRRGTALGDLLAAQPAVLHAAQYGIVALEVVSPLLLVPGRVGRVGLTLAYGFHLLTFLTIRIVFLPHLVAMLAFLPLERAVTPDRLRRSPGDGSDGSRCGAPAGRGARRTGRSVEAVVRAEGATVGSRGALGPGPRSAAPGVMGLLRPPSFGEPPPGSAPGA